MSYLVISRQDRTRFLRLFKLNPIESLMTEYGTRELKSSIIQIIKQPRLNELTISFDVGDHMSIMSFSVVFFLWHCQHNNCIFPMSKTGPPLDIGMMWSTVSKAIGKYLPQPNLEYLLATPWEPERS
jgi:hypothetical protein